MQHGPGRPRGLPKTGGRKKGSPHTKTAATIKERLRALGCDPFEILADIARGELPCGVCFGAGRTKYQPARGATEPGERTCESCWGSGKERVSPSDRARAALELCQYEAPKLRSMEVAGAGGGPIQHKHEIVFVE